MSVGEGRTEGQEGCVDGPFEGRCDNKRDAVVASEGGGLNKALFFAKRALSGCSV